MILESLKKENIKIEFESELASKQSDETLQSDVESIFYSFKISFNKKM